MCYESIYYVLYLLILCFYFVPKPESALSARYEQMKRCIYLIVTNSESLYLSVLCFIFFTSKLTGFTGAWFQLLLTLCSKYKYNLKPVTCLYRLPTHFGISHHRSIHVQHNVQRRCFIMWLQMAFCDDGAIYSIP